MNNRYYSLDVFRGATVALMILVNNPGSWSHMYAPLDHASWHGCTPTDLVFPFFLFAVGNAMAFVMPRFEQAGTSAFLKKITKRTILIFSIGLFLNWAPFLRWEGDQLVFKTWSALRIMGVLQRIALCYFFASLIVYFCKTKGAFVIACIILLLYWFICFSAGDSVAPYSLSGYFGIEIDRHILGVTHLYKGEGVPFDPEGLSSTPPAVVQVVFGYLAGQYIIQREKSYETLARLFVIAIVLITTGLCWSTAFPLNKKIWSSSYVIYTTGLAMASLSILIYLIEFNNMRGGLFRFFDVFGKNPLFIFVLSGFLPRASGLIRIPGSTNTTGATHYSSPLSWFYEHVCTPLLNNPKNSSLLYAIVLLFFYWIIAFVLDKRRIYIKV